MKKILNNKFFTLGVASILLLFILGMMLIPEWGNNGSSKKTDPDKRNKSYKRFSDEIKAFSDKNNYLPYEFHRIYGHIDDMFKDNSISEADKKQLQKDIALSYFPLLKEAIVHHLISQVSVGTLSSMSDDLNIYYKNDYSDTVRMLNAGIYNFYAALNLEQKVRNYTYNEAYNPDSSVLYEKKIVSILHDKYTSRNRRLCEPIVRQRPILINLKAIYDKYVRYSQNNAAKLKSCKSANTCDGEFNGSAYYINACKN